LLPSSRRTHVPDASGKTLNQVLSCSQTFDCGLSPVVALTVTLCDKPDETKSGAADIARRGSSGSTCSGLFRPAIREALKYTRRRGGCDEAHPGHLAQSNYQTSEMK